MMVNRIACIAMMIMVAFGSHARADRIYQEQRGIVVMEFESALAVDDWVLEREHEGYSGKGYYTWRGEDHFGQAGPGKFTFKFLIQHPDLYHLRLRSLHMHDDTSLENDVWTRMDGGYWKKTFCTPIKEWAWMTKHDFGGYKPWASYLLGKGVHALEFSGRSKNFSIDLVHLYKDGVFWIGDHSLPESPTLQSGNYTPRVDAGPNRKPDYVLTMVRGTNSFPWKSRSGLGPPDSWISKAPGGWMPKFIRCTSPLGRLGIRWTEFRSPGKDRFLRKTPEVVLHAELNFDVFVYPC